MHAFLKSRSESAGLAFDLRLDACCGASKDPPFQFTVRGGPSDADEHIETSENAIAADEENVLTSLFFSVR